MKFLMMASGTEEGTVELHLDSPEGTLLGSITCAPTGSWTEYRQFDTAITPTKGIHDICLLFRCDGEYAMNVDAFVFEKDPDGFLYGDVNQDGEITVADAVLLCRFVSEIAGTVISDDGLKAADMNQDTLLTIMDVQQILMLLIRPQPPAAPVPGDVNLDGQLTVEDVELIRKTVEAFAAGMDIPLTEQQLDLADVNGDGMIDSKDADLLEKQILGDEE